jgi:hypothetical protein
MDTKFQNEVLLLESLTLACWLHNASPAKMDQSKELCKRSQSDRAVSWNVISQIHSEPAGKLDADLSISTWVFC